MWVEALLQRVFTHQISRLHSMLCYGLAALFYRTMRVGDRIGGKAL